MSLQELLARLADELPPPVRTEPLAFLEDELLPLRDHSRRAVCLRARVRPGRLGSLRAQKLSDGDPHAARDSSRPGHFRAALTAAVFVGACCRSRRCSSSSAVVAALAPGLGAVRQGGSAQPGWLGIALRPRTALVPVLRPHVLADLLRADVTAHELPTGHVRVGGRLAGAGERCGPPSLWCLGAAQGWDAGAGNRSPHGGVLRLQERGEFRRRGGS